MVKNAAELIALYENKSKGVNDAKIRIDEKWQAFQRDTMEDKTYITQTEKEMQKMSLVKVKLCVGDIIRELKNILGEEDLNVYTSIECFQKQSGTLTEMNRELSMMINGFYPTICVVVLPANGKKIRVFFTLNPNKEAVDGKKLKDYMSVVPITYTKEPLYRVVFDDYEKLVVEHQVGEIMGLPYFEERDPHWMQAVGNVCKNNMAKYDDKQNSEMAD